MLTRIIRRTALRTLMRAGREEDEQWGSYFWKLVYLDKLRLLAPPAGVKPFDGRPQPMPFSGEPQPMPFDLLSLYDDLLFELIGRIAADPTPLLRGDPSPQPSILDVLQHEGMRLNAAKTLRKQLESAMEGLDEEIERLQQASKKT